MFTFKTNFVKTWAVKKEHNYKFSITFASKFSGLKKAKYKIQILFPHLMGLLGRNNGRGWGWGARGLNYDHVNASSLTNGFRPMDSRA